MKVVGRTELILPMPQKFAEQCPAQPVLRHRQRVLDQGRVSFSSKPQTDRHAVSPIDYDFDYDKFEEIGRHRGPVACAARACSGSATPSR